MTESRPAGSICGRTTIIMDHYHASTAGYYLEALMLFGAITGRDPRSLGGREAAAADLGLSPRQAGDLQRVAHRAIATDGACGR